jgi:hypothetical protein
MPRQTKPPKDRTSLIISVVFHVLLIGAIAFWAYKTGKLEQLRQAVLQYVRPEKKEQKRQEPVQQKAAPTTLPPINQGLPPAPSSGTRRAVAADAPSAPGESFFQDTRQQVQGPSSGSAGAAPAAKPQPMVPRRLRPRRLRSSNLPRPAPSNRCSRSAPKRRPQSRRLAQSRFPSPAVRMPARF